MTKKNIMDYINKNLEGDAQRNALDYINFLCENELSAIHQSDSTWGFDYLGENLSVVDIAGHMGPGGWVIYWGANEPSEPKGFKIDDDLKEFAWTHVGVCGQPSGKCGNSVSCGANWKIFGKDFGLVCHAPLIFNNPDTDKIIKIKKLVELRKRVIDDMKKG